MAYRATRAQVAAICDVNRDIVGTDLSGLDAFLALANDLTTNVCAGSILGYSATTLQNIEMFLAAHYYAIRDKDVRATNESAGDASRNTSDKRDMAFESTEYGKAAMAYEWQGALEALNRRVKDGVAPKPGIISLQSTKPANTSYPWWPGI